MKYFTKGRWEKYAMNYWIFLIGFKLFDKLKMSWSEIIISFLIWIIIVKIVEGIYTYYKRKSENTKLLKISNTKSTIANLNNNVLTIFHPNGNQTTYIFDTFEQALTFYKYLL